MNKAERRSSPEAEDIEPSFKRAKGEGEDEGSAFECIPVELLAFILRFATHTEQPEKNAPVPLPAVWDQDPKVPIPKLLKTQKRAEL